MDQGTTSSGPIGFDHGGNRGAVAQREFRQRYPQSGRVEQIGRKTRDTIHPDEILAENLVRLINGATNLPTPRITADRASAFRPRAAQP